MENVRYGLLSASFNDKNQNEEKYKKNQEILIKLTKMNLNKDIKHAVDVLINENLSISCYFYKGYTFLAFVDKEKHKLIFSERNDNLAELKSIYIKSLLHRAENSKMLINNGQTPPKLFALEQLWEKATFLLDAAIERLEKLNSMYKDEHGHIKEDVAHGSEAWKQYMEDIDHLVLEFECVQEIELYCQKDYSMSFEGYERKYIINENSFINFSSGNININGFIDEELLSNLQQICFNRIPITQENSKIDCQDVLEDLENNSVDGFDPADEE